MATTVTKERGPSAAELHQQARDTWNRARHIHEEVKAKRIAAQRAAGGGDWGKKVHAERELPDLHPAEADAKAAMDAAEIAYRATEVPAINEAFALARPRLEQKLKRLFEELQRLVDDPLADVRQEIAAITAAGAGSKLRKEQMTIDRAFGVQPGDSRPYVEQCRDTLRKDGWRI